MVADPEKVADDWEADYQNEHYSDQDELYEEDVYIDEIDDNYYDDYEEFAQEMKDLIDEYEERRIEENGLDY